MADSSFAALTLWHMADGALVSLALWRMARSLRSLYGKKAPAISHKANVVSGP
jgi:hypothetical protein